MQNLLGGVMNTCLALKLIAFSGCEHFVVEKGSCDFCAVTFKVLVAVYFPWHLHVLCSVTDFLSALRQVVWSQIFKGLAHVYTVLMVGVEDTGMWLSVSLCFSLSICKHVYLHFSPIPALPCALNNQFLVTVLCLLCIRTKLSREMLFQIVLLVYKWKSKRKPWFESQQNINISSGAQICIFFS